MLDTTPICVSAGGTLPLSNGSDVGISDLYLYDGVNTNGQIAFFAKTVVGSAVFRDNPAREPLLIVPGIGGTFPTGDNIGPWYLQRGVSPDTLQADPLTHVYDDLIKTFENAGYILNKDLFVVTYDWRLPAGPNDGAADGNIGGIDAKSITSDKYQYGVDYLGHFLRLAVQAWNQGHPGVPLDSVNVIAHSTGGLVTRAYIQSDAYNQLFDGVHRLPKIDNFVEYDVPNLGASKAWNPLHDDWAIDPHIDWSS